MSTILSAEDLNDFIAPGVACVKPLEVEKTSEFAEIQIGADGVPVEAASNEKLPAAQISLTDCLACSGCITSSEAVLVELQSPKELLRVVDEAAKTCVASVSPQVRASLATAYELTIKETDARIVHLFIHMLGFAHVVGTETGRVLSLESSWREVAAAPGGTPIISSVCPGWALYAEKTHPHVLPYLSQVKSPQQITGHLLKQFAAGAAAGAGAASDAASIYHVSVMPCFDKKLESARPNNTIGDAQEVDLVITAKEIEQLLRDRFDTTFDRIPASSSSYTPPPLFADSWKSNGGSSSGGYLWYILENVLAAHPGSSVEVCAGKNSDMVEYKVLLAGKTLWVGAQVYGFRNIQNIVRKLKQGKRPPTKRATNPLDYGYMEVMACPGGCTNGGGQLGATAGVAPKSWHKAVEEVYAGIERLALPAEPAVALGSEMLYTEFKPLQRDQSIPEALVVGSQW